MMNDRLPCFGCQLIVETEHAGSQYPLFDWQMNAIHYLSLPSLVPDWVARAILSFPQRTFKAPPFRQRTLRHHLPLSPAEMEDGRTTRKRLSS